jgi:hypothetical protein
VCLGITEKFQIWRAVLTYLKSQVSKSFEVMFATHIPCEQQLLIELAINSDDFW